MDQLPILKPVGKLPGIKQKIGIVRTAVLSLFGGEGFIDKDPSLAHPLFQARDQRAMEVAEDQDAPVVILFQGVYSGFQIDLPETYREVFPFHRLLGLGQGLGGSIGQDHRKTQAGQEKTVVPVSAGQIQNRAVKVFSAKRRGAKVFSKGSGAKEIPF